MKKYLENFSELKRMLILSIVIALVVILIMLAPMFAANQPGWLIGAAIGSVIEIINVFLLYKGSEYAMKSLKAGWFLIMYFLRMTLYLAGFVLTAFLGFGFLYGGMQIEPIPEFNYSIWGVLIAYTPAQIVVIISMLLRKKSPLTIAETNEENKGE